jgi:hypothetical protein
MASRGRWIILLAAAVAAALGLAASPASAQDIYTWTGELSDAWAIDGNWDEGGFPGELDDDVAVFTDHAAGVYVVDLYGEELELGILRFRDITTGGFTIQDTGPAGGRIWIGSIDQQAGENTISAKLTGTAGFTGVVSAGRLALSNTANTFAAGQTFTVGPDAALAITGTAGGHASYTLSGGVLELVSGGALSPGELNPTFHLTFDDPDDLAAYSGTLGQDSGTFWTVIGGAATEVATPGEAGISYVADGVLGGAAHFNRGGYILLPGVAAQGSGDPISMSAWVQLTTPYTSGQPYGLYGHSGTQMVHWEFTGTTRLRVGPQPGMDQTGMTSPDLGEWAHVAFVHDGAQTWYYLNGQLVRTWMGTTGSILGGWNAIGSSHTSVDLQRFFLGMIDEIAMFQHVLSLEQIQALAGLGAMVTSPGSIDVTASSTIDVAYWADRFSYNALSVADGQTLTKIGDGVLEFRQQTALNDLGAGSTLAVAGGLLRMFAQGDQSPLGPAGVVIDGGALAIVGDLGGAIDLSASDVSVWSDGGLAVADAAGAAWGALGFDAEATLTVAGAPASFAGTTFAAAGAYGLETLAPTRLGPLDAGAHVITLTKTGAADLVLEGANALAAGSVLESQAGRIVGLHDGTNNPFGAAGLTLAGGGAVLGSSTGGDKTFDNAVTVLAGTSSLAAGDAAWGDASAKTITLSGDLAVQAGAALTLQAAADHTLKLAGNVAYAGDPLALRTIDATTGAVVLDQDAGKTFSFDGTLRVTGAAVTVNDPVLSLSYLAVSDGVLDLNADLTTNAVVNTGGLHAAAYREGSGGQARIEFLGAYTVMPNRVFTGAGGRLAMEPNLGMAFSTAAVTHTAVRGPLPDAKDEHYQVAWTGQFTAPETGNYGFRIAQSGSATGNPDDHGSFFIDLNHDGVFTTGERIINVNNAQMTRELQAGVTYNIAIGFNENTGSENFGAWFTTPSITSWTLINPGAAAQAGMWNSVYGGEVKVTGGALNVASDVTVTTRSFLQFDGLAAFDGAALAAEFTTVFGGELNLLDGAQAAVGAFVQTGGVTTLDASTLDAASMLVAGGDLVLLGATQATTGAYTQTDGGVLVGGGATLTLAGDKTLSGGTFTLEGSLLHTNPGITELFLTGNAQFTANAPLGTPGVNEWSLVMATEPAITGRPLDRPTYYANVAGSVGQDVPVLNFFSTLVLGHTDAMGVIDEIDNAGLVVVAAQSPLDGVVVDFRRQAFFGGMVRIDVPQTVFPESLAYIPAYSGLGGDLTGAVLRGEGVDEGVVPDWNVVVAENTVLAFAHEANVPSREAIGGAILFRAVDRNDRLYQVGDNGSNVFKGLAFTRAFQDDGPFEGEIHNLSPSDELLIALGHDVTFTGNTTIDSDFGIRVAGTGTLRLARADDKTVQLIGESQEILRVGFYDVLDGSGFNTTGDYVAELGTAAAVGAGQTLRVEQGALRIADAAGAAAGATIVLGPRGILNLNNLPEHGMSPSSGTYVLEPGSFVRLNGAGRFAAGADWQFPTAGDHPLDFANVTVNASFDIRNELYGDGRANLFIAGGGTYAGIRAGRNRLISTPLSGQNVNNESHVVAGTGDYNPYNPLDPDGNWVMIGAPWNPITEARAVFQLAGNIRLPGVNLVINDYPDVLYDVPATGGDRTLYQTSMTGRVNLDGTNSGNIMEFHDLDLRSGWLRFGNSGNTMVGGASQITGAATVRPGAIMEVRSDYAAMRERRIFDGGIFLDPDSQLYYWFRGRTTAEINAGNNTRRVRDEITVVGNDNPVLDPNDPGIGARLRIRREGEEEATIGIVERLNLEEGAYVRVQRDNWGGNTGTVRNRLRLNVYLLETDENGSNAALMDRWDDLTEYSFLNIYGADNEDDRKTLYLNRVGGGMHNLGVFGTIGGTIYDEEDPPSIVEVLDYLTVDLVQAGLHFETGSNIGANTLILNTAPQETGRGSLVVVRTGRDATVAHYENFLDTGVSDRYLTGGRIDLANNREIQVQVQDHASTGRINFVGTTIRVYDDGDPATPDGMVNVRRDGSAATMVGTAVIDSLELMPGAYGGFNVNISSEYRFGELNNVTVLGDPGSAATLGVWSTGGGGYQNQDIGPFTNLTVGQTKVRNIHGPEGGLLNIRGQVAADQGKTFQMAGTLGIDVVINPANQSAMGTMFIEGFSMGDPARNLTLNTGDYRFFVDPGAGNIVKNGTGPLRFVHGYDGAAWNTPDGELSVTLNHASGVVGYATAGAEMYFDMPPIEPGWYPSAPTVVNQLPTHLIVGDGVANLRIEANARIPADVVSDPPESFNTRYTIPTVEYYKLSLGAGSSAVLARVNPEPGETRLPKINIAHLDLGPDGVLNLGGAELEPDSIIGAGTITGGGITLRPDGLVSPGQSAGTITIDGFFETAGSFTFSWGNDWIGPDTAATQGDLLAVVGDVILEDGWTLRVGGTEPLRAGVDYTVFTYTGALDADLGTVLIDLPTGWTGAPELVDLGGTVVLQGAVGLKEFAWKQTAPSGSWSVGTNWDPDAAPDALTEATIDVAGVTATVDAGATVHRLFVADGAVAVDPGVAFQVNTNVVVGPTGSLSVAAGGTIDAPVIHTTGATSLLGGGSVETIQADGGTLQYAMTSAREITLAGTAMTVGSGAVAGSVRADAQSSIDATHALTVTEQLTLADGVTLNVVGGSVAAAGANLAAHVERLTLQGGASELTVKGAFPVADPTFYLSFDDPNNLGRDDSGSGYDATSIHSSVTYVEDPNGGIGGAARFTGAGGIWLPVLPAQANQPVSMSLWLNWAGGSGSQGIYGHDGWTDPAQPVHWELANGRLRLGGAGTAPGNVMDQRSLPNPDYNVWAHLAFSHDGSTTTYYLNGNPVRTWEGMTGDIFGGNWHVIGGSHGTISRWFNGMLDEVAMFQGRALTTDEIAALYQAGLNGFYSGGRDMSSTELWVAEASQLSLVMEDAAFGNLHLAADLTLAGAPVVSFNNVTGSGTVVAPAVAVRGALGPGNSFGTINVQGDAVLGGASTYAVELAGRGATLVSDQVHVSGSLTIEEGGKLTLNWVPSDTGSMFGGTYRIATYGSLDGTFDAPAKLTSNVFDYIYDIDYAAEGGTAIDVTLYNLLAGDADLDGKVAVTDLGALATNWGMTEGATWAMGDFDFDGAVSVTDLGALATNWGKPLVLSSLGGGGGFEPAGFEPAGLGAGGGESALVPEPGTWIMLLLGSLALAAIGRRRRRPARK